MSEATAPATEPTTTTPAPPATEPAGTEPDLAAELAAIKAEARKWEERAKANTTAARELEELRRQSMSDQEKAVADAIAKARAEALAEVGGDRAADAIRGAAAGRGLDVEALLEGIDAGKFLTADGRPDRERITAWLDQLAPVGTQAQARVDLGQGTRVAGGDAPLNGDPLLRDLKAKLGIA